MTIKAKLAAGLIALGVSGGVVALTASPASAQAACSISQNLTLGERGSDDVRCLQTALDAAGFSPGPVDGYFGPVTEAAVSRYQTAKSLIVDGWVGPQTAGSLEIWSAKVATVARVLSPEVAIVRSTTGTPWNGNSGGVYLPSYARTVLAQGRCNWLAPYLAAAGLPVSTFQAISARESGCAQAGVHVANSTDLSTSRFGLNFRGSMPGYWAGLCGVSDYRVPGSSVSTDARCAAAAYARSGLSPWAVG